MKVTQSIVQLKHIALTEAKVGDLVAFLNTVQPIQLPLVVRFGGEEAPDEVVLQTIDEVKAVAYGIRHGAHIAREEAMTARTN